MSLLIGLVAVAMVGLAVAALRLRPRLGAAATLTAVVCAALVYENGVLAAGVLLGEGDLLRTLNVGRYVGHALFTPLLIPAGALLAARFGVAWFARPPARAAVTALTAAMVLLGVWLEVVRLEPVARRTGGVLRYANAAAVGPPVPALVAIVALVVVGAVVWRRAGWPWLFAGAVAMFVAAGAGVRLVWPQNLGELALQSALVATAAAAAGRATPALGAGRLPRPRRAGPVGYPRAGGRSASSSGTAPPSSPVP
jgi:hypothetical protein